MLTEIARLGRPLQIYALPERPSLARRALAALERLAPLGAAIDALRLWGLAGWPRDLTALHDLLVREGRATRLGEQRDDAAPLPERPPEDELARVVERVRTVLEQAR
jgi:hypothetical protein